jgi:hypothetical protein
MAGAAANCVTDMFMALLRVARRGRAQTAHHEVNPIAVLVMAVLIAEGLRDELLLGEVCLRAANWARRVESLSHAAADAHCAVVDLHSGLRRAPRAAPGPRAIPVGRRRPRGPDRGGPPHGFQASLYQLIAAARLPGSGISEIAVNASWAFIEGAKPRERSIIRTRADR